MFKFNFDEKEYILDDEHFDGLINDDEKPVRDIEIGRASCRERV